jgi:hypothetical protein
MTVEAFDRRPAWKRAVRRSARLHPQTKRVLLVLHDHMRADGKVSVTRRTVADELGWRHVQRVSEHITEAREAGFLVTVVEGAFGRPATWQAVFPGDVTVRKTRTVRGFQKEGVTVRRTRTVRGSGGADAYDPSKRPHGADTITRADPSCQAQTETFATTRGD